MKLNSVFSGIARAGFLLAILIAILVAADGRAKAQAPERFVLPAAGPAPPKNEPVEFSPPPPPPCSNVKWVMAGFGADHAWRVDHATPAGCAWPDAPYRGRFRFPLFRAIPDGRAGQAVEVMEREPHPNHFRRLEEIESRLRRVFGNPFSIEVRDSPEVNAEAPIGAHGAGKTPRIVVDHGMLEFDLTIAELAFVIGHEIGHTADRRGDEELERIGLLEALFEKSRRQQREFLADCVGLQYIIGAGYDEYAPGGFLGKMMQLKGVNRKGRLTSAWEDTHPPSQDRIDKLRDCYFGLEKSGRLAELRGVASRWKLEH